MPKYHSFGQQYYLCPDGVTDIYSMMLPLPGPDASLHPDLNGPFSHHRMLAYRCRCLQVLQHVAQQQPNAAWAKRLMPPSAAHVSAKPPAPSSADAAAEGNAADAPLSTNRPPNGPQLPRLQGLLGSLQQQQQKQPDAAAHSSAKGAAASVAQPQPVAAATAADAASTSGRGHEQPKQQQPRRLQFGERLRRFRRQRWRSPEPPSIALTHVMPLPVVTDCNAKLPLLPVGSNIPPVSAAGPSGDAAQAASLSNGLQAPPPSSAPVALLRRAPLPQFRGGSRMQDSVPLSVTVSGSHLSCVNRATVQILGQDFPAVRISHHSVAARPAADDRATSRSQSPRTAELAAGMTVTVDIPLAVAIRLHASAGDASSSPLPAHPNHASSSSPVASPQTAASNRSSPAAPTAGSKPHAPGHSAATASGASAPATTTTATIATSATNTTSAAATSSSSSSSVKNNAEAPAHLVAVKLQTDFHDTALLRARLQSYRVAFLGNDPAATSLLHTAVSSQLEVRGACGPGLRF